MIFTHIRKLSAADILRAAADAEDLRFKHPGLPPELISNASLVSAGIYILSRQRWKDGAAVLAALSPSEISALSRKVYNAGLLCTDCAGCDPSLFENLLSPDRTHGGNPNFDPKRFEELKNR